MMKISGIYSFFVYSLIIFAELCQAEVNVTGNEQFLMYTESFSPVWRKAMVANTYDSLFLKTAIRTSSANQKLHKTGGNVGDRMNLIFDRIHSLSPTFMLSSDKIKDDRCKRENNVFVKHLQELKLWALKMYDSSGKITSGFLNGNVNQFGDFDQCVNVKDEENDIAGKYCLAYFQVTMELTQNDRLSKIFDLVQSHHVFKSTMQDPGHRVPRFSTINWAVCIPSSCSHEEVESQMRDAVQQYTEGTAFDVQVKIDEEMCYTKKPHKFPSSFIIVSVLLGSVAILVILSTVRDFMMIRAGTSIYTNLLECFSLRRNLKQLVSTSRAPDDINSIHGIRMTNALLLLLSHKSMAMFFAPFSNRTFMVESLAQPWTIVARMASLYTDSFIMISGILTSYSFSKELKRNGYLDIKSEYKNRLIRIFPLLTVTILLSTFIIPETGSGPQWGLTVEHHSHSCKKSWWKNFLFIHNYFGFENMCLTHTHHLGIDTQLFFLSPILVYALHKWQLAGLSLLMSLASISTALRYHLTFSKDLSYFIYPGISVKQMMDTANFSYIIPSHRLTVYIIGIITGYILQHYGKECKLKSHVRRFWWTATFSLFYYVISKAASMSRLDYEYDKYEVAAYSALAPVAWCLFLGWIIFASHTGNGGIVGGLFSSKYFVIWTRISYAVYLIQFPIFFFNVGRLRYPQDFSIFSLVNVLEYSSVASASVVLTLLYDMPVSNMRKLFRRK